ncbi:DUF1080 domain-containing protein [Pseudoflavitalea sp. G-6-1-2]|uniref:3-keto-disaccharide hydrolase n=1 Tax=Pseudoflavitalea sp. G-6-1-2 TaxID=2728841 RepID=UPI00146A4B8F|nr:DUF1080 domain-containing protein [Pseudoflavitalea sp. G-6-1-2]NML22647.1 DUF1080 domain-containing protein [Pseudoflavitalea sp. G-6-1-2]
MKKILQLALAVLSISAANAQSSEKGWTSLFDGKSLDGWKKLGKAEYRIENGAITGITVPNSPNTFLMTEKVYGDFILEMDMFMEDTTSNSGIQFRSHINPEGNNGAGRVFGYQLDVDPSSRKWTGGIYDEGRREWLYALSLNKQAQPAFRNGEWNKFRIEAIGHEIKTWVNGIPCAYMIDTVDASGFIALQVHAIKNESQAGKKIFWKNIRIKTSGLKSTPFPKDIYVYNAIPNTLTEYEKKSGWKLLFDGKTTNGWKGAYKPGFPEKGWEVKDGELRVLGSDGKESTNGGDIVTLDQYSAFDISWDFKLTTGANSGLKYFVTLSENNKGSAIGLEYQMLDDKVHPDAKLGRDGNRTLASLYDLITAVKPERFVKQPGNWNTARLIVYPNNHVEHYLNGLKVLEYDRGSEAFRQLVALSKYKVWPNFGEAPKGHILLQDHGDAVSFRSIKIRKL